MITLKINMATTEDHYSPIEDVYKDFSKDKGMFHFSNYSSQKYYDDFNKLVVGKMKDETSGVSI